MGKKADAKTKTQIEKTETETEEKNPKGFERSEEIEEHSHRAEELWGAETEAIDSERNGRSGEISEEDSKSSNISVASSLERISAKRDEILGMVENIGIAEFNRRAVLDARAGKFKAQIKLCELCKQEFPAVRSWAQFCTKEHKNYSYWKNKLIADGFVVDVNDIEGLSAAIDRFLDLSKEADAPSKDEK